MGWERAQSPVCALSSSWGKTCFTCHDVAGSKCLVPLERHTTGEYPTISDRLAGPPIRFLNLALTTDLTLTFTPLVDILTSCFHQQQLSSKVLEYTHNQDPNQSDHKHHSHASPTRDVRPSLQLNAQSTTQRSHHHRAPQRSSRYANVLSPTATPFVFSPYVSWAWLIVDGSWAFESA